MMEDMTSETYFNWVKARSDCSLRSAFHLLSEFLDSDVKAANELGGDPFKLNRVNNNKLVVLRDVKESPESVVFELSQTEITVRSGETLKFVARPSLQRNGLCLLEVNGFSLDLWQVSRMALEEFFFRA